MLAAGIAIVRCSGRYRYALALLQASALRVIDWLPTEWRAAVCSSRACGVANKMTKQSEMNEKM